MTKREIINQINELYNTLKNLEINSQNNFIMQAKIIDIYRQYLQLLVQIQNPIPHLEDNYQLQNGNCYFYALALPIPSYFKKIYQKTASAFTLNVGELSNTFNYYPFNSKDVLEYLYADLEYLKIKYYASNIKDNPQHNGYKIALFVDEYEPDYHFMRQNIDGTWSQKYGYNGSILITPHVNDFLLDSPHYEYVKTLEIVKPTIRR